MSSGYASRLSEYKAKGVCGLPESRETQRNLGIKLQRLVTLLRESKHTVVLTGAGISTSAGIPDFRGPKGIWTLEKNTTSEKKRKRTSDDEDDDTRTTLDDFSKAKPTLTHRAIAFLIKEKKIHYCITQNVDGLHRRSGLSRSHHAVLHGCVFTEKCEDCSAEHFRDFDVGGMSFQKTGRACEVCKGALRDILLDWEDPLPEQDHEQAEDQCERADLVLCLGTSLRIRPAGDLPSLAKKFVIVNLQQTPYDKDASMVIRAPVDDVMAKVMEELGYQDWDKGVENAQVERVWKPPPTKEST